MTALLIEILTTIRIAEEIINKMLDGMTPEQKQQLWGQHMEIHNFWKGIFDKIFHQSNLTPEERKTITELEATTRRTDAHNS
jgi:hypothetical protein